MWRLTTLGNWFVCCQLELRKPAGAAGDFRMATEHVCHIFVILEFVTKNTFV